MKAAPLTLALWAMLAVAAFAQTAPTSQVAPGSSAAIAKGKQVGAPQPETAEGRKIFKDAQSAEVRKTLQEAIDSAPAPKQ